MVTIEKARYEDAQVVLAIRSAAILRQCASHYPLDVVKAWAGIELSDEFSDSVERHFYLAKRNNQVIGTGMIDPGIGKVDAIFVRPNHMRSGVGQNILKFLESVALSRGLKMMTLQSTLNAAGFYRACGFVGDEVETYTTSTGVSLDCIPMTKGISQLAVPANPREGHD